MGEVLLCTREPGHRHNPHTVAAKKGDIEHLQHNLSAFARS